jgi:tetratricopeptide (TPR) repeat protein
MFPLAWRAAPRDSVPRFSRRCTEMTPNGETRSLQKPRAKPPLRRRLLKIAVVLLVFCGVYTSYCVWRTVSLWERARLLYEAGDYARAVPAFKEHLKADPDDAYSHYWLANALGLSGQIEEAITQFRRAVELEAENAEYHAGLANALWMQKRFPQAEQSYDTAIRLDPKNPQWRTELGFLFISENKRQEARSSLRRALEIDPAYEHALMGIRLLNGEKIAPSREVEPRFRKHLDRT